MHTLTRPHTIAEIAEDALNWIGDQPYLTQSRCVDVLLDLYQAADDPFTSWAIAGLLDDIRYLTKVEGDQMRADLAAIVDMTAISLPPRRWCDQLLADATPVA
jgi:hypothetical protein